MNRSLFDCVAGDLEVWGPELDPDVREAMARRIAEHLDSQAGRAEQRLKEVGTISWLFDARSGQLLVTYPNGANRIRAVASPAAGSVPPGPGSFPGSTRRDHMQYK